MRTAFRSPVAADRFERATAWLAGRSPGEEVLIVAASREAASEVVRQSVLGSGAVFGWQRVTLGRLAAEIADETLAETGLVPLTRLGAEGVVARVVQELRGSGALGRYEVVADTPGFARAVAAPLEELRLGLVDMEPLGKVDPGLSVLADRYAAVLAATRLADRSLVYGIATGRLGSGTSHPWIGLPVLLLDVPIRSRAEAGFVEALIARAPQALATTVSGDDQTTAALAAAGLSPDTAALATSHPNALTRVQARLFEESALPEGGLGEEVVVFSAPGESRECVEIARRLLRHARDGVRFDRMAVLLRSVEEYRPHLEEAFDRAGIPAYFTRGAVRPDPSGRAFLALLGCAAERLSARRFAEYLSLGEVADTTPGGGPPPAAPDGDRWVAPDEELVPEKVADALAEWTAAGVEGASASQDAERRPRAPRRWEQLLVDSAVIGGLDRWRRRLDGLGRELELDLEEVDDPEDPAAEALRSRLAELASLRAHALPLLEDLAGLPERAVWGEWLGRLSGLATRTLRQPGRVLATLAELAPMAEVGPVDLHEVRLVLTGRLLEIVVPPPKSRQGRVFVGPAGSARGLVFEVVFVPGLAEKLFPRQIREDPILLDRSRLLLGGGLPTNEQRLQEERLALRIAVGSASRRLFLSYPRLDLEKGRPRVPSFYALEAVRAAEGRLPGFDELATRAENVVHARAGWPAPRSAEEAIDEAEHDLALLDSILRLDEERSVGTARYLLTVNPHLSRALRFRARRWLRRWTPADGLVDPSAAAVATLSAHRLAARSYSPTALEHYSACPYRFFLQAIHRLAPREVPEAIEEMDALQRGSLVHEIQFEFFRRLETDGLLPVTSENLETAREILEEVIATVAGRHREELAPAIGRVWNAGIDGVRVDLREWLRRISVDDTGFVPWRFELAFGLRERRRRDRDSRPEPVPLDAGLRLRGSIDLVERDGAGRIRVTDHKTGIARFPKDGLMAGGSVLQPILYALAVEKMFPESEVTEGRLWYCTVNGGFEVRSVPLDEAARTGARTVADAVEEALSEGFFPALPRENACVFCDYRIVCGPYEELRTRRKPPDRSPVDTLRRLRETR